MKTASIVLACLAATVLTAEAQTTGAPTGNNPSPTQLPADTAYQVVKRGPNHSVWQRNTYALGRNGKIVTTVHQYNELATGLNFWRDGQWLPSQEDISILSDGSAVATNGQHQAGFPGDIAQGVIDLLTPDGKLLESRPVGLFYEDANNSVLIALLTNSVGELVTSNQVVYPNAFEGAQASIRYTYTKGGFEQDVIVQGQLPDPSKFGLNPASTRLGVLTAFFDTNNPVTTAMPANLQDDGLSDTTLTFGTMQVIQGRAFSIGNDNFGDPAQTGTPTYKKWLQIDGRRFLLEEVPYPNVAPKLEKLPPMTGRLYSGSTNLFAANTLWKQVPAGVLARPKTGVSAQSPKLRLARTERDSLQGFVLDYVTVNSSVTNFVFQGDTTYYLSANMYLYGTVTIEGGTVIKFPNYSIVIEPTCSVNCITGPYRPAVFTAKDDDTVGETISGSTGNPSGVYGFIYLDFSAPANPLNLHDLRVLYAFIGIYLYGGSGGHTIRDCQFVKDSYPIYGSGSGSCMLENLLLSQTPGYAIEAYSSTTFGAAQLTIDQASHTFYSSSGGALNLTNSLLVSITNSGSSYTSVNNATNSSSSAVFQVVGGGSHYLATNTYRASGLTNIDPVLLADLATKTTYPPMVYSNLSLTTNLVLSPQVARDTNAAPDLGYHYDPLDYVFGGCDLHTNLTINAGTAVGLFKANTPTFWMPDALTLEDGAAVTSTGLAKQPCWLVRTATVQEGGNGNWTTENWMSTLALNGSGSDSIPQLTGSFTKFSGLSGIWCSYQDAWAYGVASFSATEFYISLICSYQSDHYFTNCLFFRPLLPFWDQDDAASFTFLNCTLYGGAFAMYRADWQNPSFWCIENTAFDGTAILTVEDDNNGDTNYMYFNNNSYNLSNTNWVGYDFGVGMPATNLLETIGANDLMLTNDYNWQTSWLGAFYLPTNSLLIDMGNPTADQLGLYHFTTQTNQMVEGDSLVDIGYHYVATDAYGNSLDTNGDGIPDYLEDANGNGIFDAGDLGDWKISPYGLSGTNGLVVFTPMK